MCKFFSCVSDGNGKTMYFDAAIRKEIIADKLTYQADSHTSIADYYGYKGAAEDKLNKYEYNPLTGVFIVNQINTTDDSKQVEKFCRELDFKTIVPELIIKPIINPLLVKRKTKTVTKKEIALLKNWASVGAASACASIRDLAWASDCASAWASVRDSVGAASIGTASVEASVWASAWASAWDSVWAYVSSFFNIKYKYDFSCCTKLWEAGLVPSYDGNVWRLHAGPKATIIYETKNV